MLVRVTVAVSAASLMAVGCSSGESNSGSDAEGPGVRAVAEDFLADLKVGAWNAAYSRMHGRLQQRCGDAEGLRRAVESHGQPASWTLRDPKTGENSVTITGAFEPKYDPEVAHDPNTIVEMSLDKVDGQWQVWDWAVRNQSVCG